MIVQTIDGHEIKWVPKSSPRENCSKLHDSIRALLKELYPTQPILEEVPIPITKKQTQYFDFFLPINKLAVEADGQQHTKFVPHFHRTYANFIVSQKNDRLKSEFCDINNIRLVRLSFDEQRIWSEVLLSPRSL